VLAGLDGLRCGRAADLAVPEHPAGIKDDDPVADLAAWRAMTPAVLVCISVVIRRAKLG
jgi:hypothetical protein